MGGVGVAPVNFDNAVSSTMRHLGFFTFPFSKCHRITKPISMAIFPNLDLSMELTSARD
jgi:hypothetical protein